MRNAQFESLSISSLRHIWDDRSRHGIDLVAVMISRGSPHVALLKDLRKRRKQKRKTLRALRTAISSKGATSKVARELKKRRAQVDAATNTYLRAVQADLVHPAFHFGVDKGPPPVAPAKQTYRLVAVNPDAAYFAAQVLQDDLERSFGLKFPERNNIVDTFTNVLRGKWSKTVVRADVDGFYESIDHQMLLELVHSNHSIATMSKIWIGQILAAYQKVSPLARAVGLPRGVGPSAHLAEVFMKQFDHAVRDRPECVFYARYVDDILAIMAPVDSRDLPASGYLAEMQSQLATRGLTLSAKTAKRSEQIVDKASTVHQISITILGYQIEHWVSNGSVKVDFSPERKKRLRSRLERTFEVFERSKSLTGESARLLERRVRFLASNSRLVNSKRDAFVGIYFSNSKLSEVGYLKKLDGILSARLARLSKLGVSPGILNRLKKSSFVDGFKDVRFINFSSSEWRSVVSIWRDIV